MRLSFRSPFARQVLVLLTSILVLTFSGGAASASGLSWICPTWPYCAPAALSTWLQYLHMVAGSNRRHPDGLGSGDGVDELAGPPHNSAAYNGDRHTFLWAGLRGRHAGCSRFPHAPRDLACSLGRVSLDCAYSTGCNCCTSAGRGRARPGTEVRPPHRRFLCLGKAMDRGTLVAHHFRRVGCRWTHLAITWPGMLDLVRGRTRSCRIIRPKSIHRSRS